MMLSAEERERQAYFHRNADPVVHQNERRYWHISCWLCSLEGAIEATMEHEAKLMACVPYSEFERVQVQSLFEEERDCLRRWFEGVEVPLLNERRRIAQDRLVIRAAAMERAASQPATLPLFNLL